MERAVFCESIYGAKLVGFLQGVMTHEAKQNSILYRIIECVSPASDWVNLASEFASSLSWCDTGWQNLGRGIP